LNHFSVRVCVESIRQQAGSVSTRVFDPNMNTTGSVLHNLATPDWVNKN
jgi:hypothetical protein